MIGKYVWVLHGPNGQRLEFRGGRDKLPIAAQAVLQAQPQAELKNWTIESWRA